MRVYANGALITTKTSSDSDNFGYVNRIWPAGNYSVFVKVNWSTNDTKDFGFRFYAPQAYNISKITFTNNSEVESALNKMNLVSAKASLSSFGYGSNALFINHAG